VHVTKDIKETHVNLLVIQNIYRTDDDNDYIDDFYGDINDEDDDVDGEDDNEEPIRYNFVLIKDLAKLVSTQLTKNRRQKYICDRCLHYFTDTKSLENHVEDYKNQNFC